MVTAMFVAKKNTRIIFLLVVGVLMADGNVVKKHIDTMITASTAS